MGYKKAKTEYMTFGFSPSNPLDSTEYRFLTVDTPLSTVPLYESFLMPPNSIITRVVLYCMATNAYTNEGWTLILRNFTAGTDNTLGTFTWSSPSYSASSIDVSTNLILSSKEIQFKTVTPAWVTNPIGISGCGYIEFIRQ